MGVQGVARNEKHWTCQQMQ